MTSEEIRADYAKALKTFTDNVSTYNTPEKIIACMIGMMTPSVAECSAQLSEIKLSLRDRIAISTMQGLFSSNSDEFWVDNPINMKETSAHAYSWADAMLKARGEKL